MDREEIEVWKSFLKIMMSKINKAWILLTGNENRSYCNREGNPAQTNIIFHLCIADWMFSRENAGVRRGNKWELKQSRGNRNVQKERERLINVNMSFGFVNWHSSKLSSWPPTKTRRQGSYVQILNRANSKLICPPWAFPELEVGYGYPRNLEMLETMLIFVQVS